MGLSFEWQVIDALAPLLLKTVEGCIVEIGIGRSTQILGEHAKTFKRTHHSVDTSIRKCDWARQGDVTHPYHVVHHCRSSTFIKEIFKDIPALLLIDGQHNAPVVEMEVDFFISVMAPNGIMFMHDTCPMEGYYERKLETKHREMDTYKVRNLLEKRDDIDIFTWRQGCGLSMVLKKDANWPFYRL
jgi:hypothetical protein